MKCCDCDERIGVRIDSGKQFEELKSFFEEQVEKGIFVEKPVKKPYYIGRVGLLTKMKWYADKLYQCEVCGVLWEFIYPDFPTLGEVRKFNSNRDYKKGITKTKSRRNCR